MRTPDGYSEVIKTARAKADAAILLFSPVFYSERVRIAALALQARLPTIHQDRWYVESGGLLSYGPDVHEVLRRAAYFIDRLLKGAKPNELPMEQPTKFELAMNLKSARVLGITIPESVLLRADEVIR